jgi:hypothetical protein
MRLRYVIYHHLSPPPQKQIKMEKYYYKVDEGNFAEHCKLYPCKIGSELCKRCTNCNGYDNEEHWIKCKQLDKAIKVKDSFNVEEAFKIYREAIKREKGAAFVNVYEVKLFKQFNEFIKTL